jgi:hypothetical protein
MNRRSFLRGMLTVTAVSIVPLDARLHAGIPRIVGDGIHDDGPGLLAAVNGRPFVADGLVVSEQSEVKLGAGVFRMTETLRFDTPNIRVTCTSPGETLIVGDHDGPYIIYVSREASHVELNDLRVTYAPGRSGDGVVLEPPVS